MRNLVKLTAVCLSLFLLASCGNNNVDWEKYTSNEGGFIIQLPTPVKKTDKKDIFWKGTTHFFSWKPSAFAIYKIKLFQVSYTDCPPGVSTDSLLLNVMLDSAIMVRKKDFTDAEDIPSQTIELNGYQGRAFFFDGGGNTLVTVKECIANNRLYDLVAITKKNYSTNNEINTFFNSFQPFR